MQVLDDLPGVLEGCGQIASGLLQGGVAGLQRRLGDAGVPVGGGEADDGVGHPGGGVVGRGHLRLEVGEELAVVGDVVAGRLGGVDGGLEVVDPGGQPVGAVDHGVGRHDLVGAGHHDEVHPVARHDLLAVGPQRGGVGGGGDLGPQGGQAVAGVARSARRASPGARRSTAGRPSTAAASWSSAVRRSSIARSQAVWAAPSPAAPCGTGRVGPSPSAAKAVPTPPASNRRRAGRRRSA